MQLESRISCLTSQLEAAAQEAVELRRRSDLGESRLAEVSDAHSVSSQLLSRRESEVAELKRSVRRAEERSTHLESEVRFVTSCRAKLDEQLGELRADHQKLEARHAELGSEKLRLESEIAMRSHERRRVAEQLAPLPDAVQALRARLADTLAQPLEELIKALSPAVPPPAAQ